MNLSAGLAGLSQGLSQQAGFADKEQERADHQRDLQLAALRAENLARLKDMLEYTRQSALQKSGHGLRAQEDQTRLTTEHNLRQQDIQTQEKLRGQNRKEAQSRSFDNQQKLQDNALVNQNEYRTRAQMAQSNRDAMRAAETAKNDKLKITQYLAQYQSKNPMLSAGADGGLDIQGLAKLAQHDMTLRSYLNAYEEADNREKSAHQFLSNTTRSPGMFMGASSEDPNASTSADSSDSSPLIPMSSSDDGSDDEGPGVANSPYSSPPVNPDDTAPAIEPDQSSAQTPDPGAT